MMCELTFADLGVLNPTYFVQQSIINALANNHDGIGYMQEGNVWKSHLSGALIDNLGSMAGDSLTKAPVAFHTRYATNKQLNEDCHSHPFRGEKLILMHNGKLAYKDDTLIPHNKVDSQIFTENLEAAIVESPDIPIVDLMQNVMDKWCGKFAFMIYDTRDSEYYVIRGTTAKLHWTTVNGKLVVNTEKIDLLKGTHILRQLNQIMHGKDLEVGKIEELEKNSIYKFNKKESELSLVGEVTENKAPLVSSTYWVNDRRYAGGTTSAVGAISQVRNKEREPAFEKIKRWMNFHDFSLNDINELSNVLMGVSLLELNSDDLRCLYMDICKKLTELSNAESLKWWGEISRKGYARWAYSQKGFSFPWMMNDNLDIADMCNLVDEEVEIRKQAKKIRLAN